MALGGKLTAQNLSITQKAKVAKRLSINFMQEVIKMGSISVKKKVLFQ
jgi:hypothetical protein